jgi:hypothetical protein
MRPIFNSASVLCLFALLAACGQKSGDTAMKGDVVEKIERPGGGVAVISTKETVDAKTPPRIHVYLQKSQDPAQSVEVLDMERAAPLRMTWVDATGLHLEVECGRVHRFSNFADLWSGKDEAHAEQIVVMLDNRGVCPG